MLDWARDDEREVEVVSGCYLVARRTTLAQIGLLDEMAGEVHAPGLGDRHGGLPEVILEEPA